MSQGLTSREEFGFLADLVMRHSSGDHTSVSLHDARSGTTRFADNQIIQNVDTRKTTFRVTVAYGQRHGSASTTALTAGAVQETITRAERIARVAPEDAEYVPPLGPQEYLAVPSWDKATQEAGPTRRLAEAAQGIVACRDQGLSGAGIVTTADIVSAVATSMGLRAYEPRTEARFSLTATGGDATGWAANAHRSIERLGVRERTQVAIEKARAGGGARELPAGRYTVILEPAAVAGLLSWMVWLLDAKSYFKGTSPYAGCLGRRIVDPRLTLRNRPAHPDLLGQQFHAEGVPSVESLWIKDGVLTQLAFDRYTARQHQVEPLPMPDAPCLSAEGAGEDLIATTERGILITNFWYLRVVNPTDLTLTGMTRDGTFLVEEGRVRCAVKNFRFHESPVRAFSQLEDCTRPMEAVTSETGKLLVPAMRIRDFPFSSVTMF